MLAFGDWALIFSTASLPASSAEGLCLSTTLKCKEYGDGEAGRPGTHLAGM